MISSHETLCWDGEAELGSDTPATKAGLRPSQPYDLVTSSTAKRKGFNGCPPMTTKIKRVYVHIMYI